VSRFAAIAVGAIGAGVACGHAPAAAPANRAREGVSIALYDRAGEGYAIVDDRRWVEVAGDALELGGVDPRAALPSLVIEPLDGEALEIGACTRARLPVAPPAPAAFAPALSCGVAGAPGRRLVRILYIVPQLTYRASHDVAITRADQVTVVSRFAIATPAWHVRADATLFDGAPGGEPPPREIGHGVVMLDGGTAVIATPPHTVAAQLRRVYEGAVRTGGEIPARDPRWRRDSQSAIWVWLELDGTPLSLGPVHAHVELAGEPQRDIDVPAPGRRQTAAALRLPLWIDDQLRGTRERQTLAPDDGALIDHVVLSLANLGDAARDVWFEEPLRPARHRTVRRAWPAAPSASGSVLRLRLQVPAGNIARAGFDVAYEL
jgi:hypothetical protein